MDDWLTRMTYIFLQLEQILIAVIMKKDFQYKKSLVNVSEASVDGTPFEDNCSEQTALDS